MKKKTEARDTVKETVMSVSQHLCTMYMAKYVLAAAAYSWPALHACIGHGPGMPGVHI